MPDSSNYHYTQSAPKPVTRFDFIQELMKINYKIQDTEASIEHHTKLMEMAELELPRIFYSDTELDQLIGEKQFELGQLKIEWNEMLLKMKI